jgi:hypothetical protein
MSMTPKQQLQIHGKFSWLTMSKAAPGSNKTSAQTSPASMDPKISLRTAMMKLQVD